MISAAQCRAARAMLDWSQKDLSENAQIARPTVADFERNVRTPIRNNLISIVSAFEAAGLSFIAENGQGAGVRFREFELEYSKVVRGLYDEISIAMKYRGKRFSVIVPPQIIDDMDRTNYETSGDRIRSVTNNLRKYIVSVEKKLATIEISDNGRVVLESGDFLQSEQ